MPPDLLSDIREALAAADATDDSEVKAIYTGIARNRHVRLVAEAQSISTILLGREREMARVARLAK